MSISENCVIIETCGKQCWMLPLKYYDLDRVFFKNGLAIALNRVLLSSNIFGITLGKPYLEKYSIRTKIVRHLRGEKVSVFKMRPKKKTRLKKGYRHELTRVFVKSFNTLENVSKTFLPSRSAGRELC